MYVLFCIAAGLVFSELFYFRIADRFHILDKPNERSSHRQVTLRGGGVIFLLGIWFYTFFYGWLYPWFLVGLTGIAAVSFADDIRSVSPKIRSIVHCFALLLMFYQWGIFSAGLGWYLLPITIVCMGIINAYNFMDGINGITGGYSLAVLLPLLWVNRLTPFVDPHLIGVAILSVLVFCFFNFRTKAKCFAGDIGSVSMAYILLFILGGLIWQSKQGWYLLFLAVYGVDSVLTICHRLLLHENLFLPHRQHLYQLMANELNIRHVTIASVYTIVQLIVSFGALFLPVDKWIYFGGVITILSAGYVLFKKKYYPLHERSLHSTVSYPQELKTKIHEGKHEPPTALIP